MEPWALPINADARRTERAVRVPLLNFEDRRRRYELDTDAGEVTAQECATELDAETGTRGMAAYVKVGLRERRQAFFAFYVADGSLHLVADGSRFDLASDATRVKRTSVAPFVKRFSVYQGDNRAGSWLYWFTDLREDGFIPKDFLSYIAREVAPPASQRGKILFWEESAAGRDPTRPAFQEELKQLLQSTD